MPGTLPEIRQRLADTYNQLRAVDAAACEFQAQFVVVDPARRSAQERILAINQQIAMRQAILALSEGMGAILDELLDVDSPPPKPPQHRHRTNGSIQ